MKKILLIVLVGALFLTACSNKGDTEISEGDIPEDTQIANPASVYCEDNGGTVEIITSEDGSQIGYCILPDGTECEEWDYFREECPE
ncbi:MAG: DUF333 domain-containing protein [Candidatus Nanoarchaeia archaeon]|nr:DUF333 domain-containing protein [Candidatus Nanoarchaeia archaeon]